MANEQYLPLRCLEELTSSPDAGDEDPLDYARTVVSHLEYLPKGITLGFLTGNTYPPGTVVALGEGVFRVTPNNGKGSERVVYVF